MKIRLVSPRSTRNRWAAISISSWGSTASSASSPASKLRRSAGHFCCQIHFCPPGCSRRNPEEACPLEFEGGEVVIGFNVFSNSFSRWMLGFFLVVFEGQQVRVLFGFDGDLADQVFHRYPRVLIQDGQQVDKGCDGVAGSPTLTGSTNPASANFPIGTHPTAIPSPARKLGLSARQNSTSGLGQGLVGFAIGAKSPAISFSTSILARSFRLVKLSPLNHPLPI